MKVNSTVHFLKSMGGLILFALFTFFISSDSNAQCPPGSKCNVSVTGGTEPVPIIINLNTSSAMLNNSALSNEIAPAGGCGYPGGTTVYTFLVFDNIPSDGDSEAAGVRTLDCADVGAGIITKYAVLEDLGDGTVGQYDADCDGRPVELAITVNDAAPPQLNDPMVDCSSLDRTRDCAIPEATILANLEADVEALYFDNCGTVNATANTSLTQPFNGNCSPTTTVNLTIDDGNGNSVSCDVNVTVQDNSVPTWDADEADITISVLDKNLAPNGRFMVVELDCDDPDLASKLTYLRDTWKPDAVDDCSTPVVNELADQQLAGPFTCPEIDRYTVLYEAVDECGNTTMPFSETFRLRIEIHDLNSPTFAGPPVNPPANITLTADPGQCSVDLTGSNLLEVTAEDCDNITYSYTITGALNTTGSDNNANEIYPVGTSTITYEAADNCNAPSNYVINLTVEDNENPVIEDVKQNADSLGTDLFACSAFYSWMAPDSLSDNCGLASFTCEVTDQDGNVVPTFNTSPSGCSNQTGFAGEWAPGFWTASDPALVDESNAPASVSLTGGPSFSATTTYCITVADDGQISFNYSKSIFGSATAYSVNGTRTIFSPIIINGSGFVDVEQGDLFCFEVDDGFIPNTLTITDFSFSCFGTQKNATLPKGTNLITYTLVDIHGNDTTCVDTVVVYDDEAPTLDDCDDQEMNTVCPDASIPDYTTNNNVSDNCPMVTVAQSPDPSTTLGDLQSADSIYFGGSAGASLQDGAYYFVNLVATDMGGNKDTCRFRVTLNDQNEPIPDVDPLPDINPMTTLGTDCGSYTLCAPTATDCNGTVIYATATIAGATFDPNGCGAGMPAYTFNQAGVWSITWIYDDGNGNIATQQQSVEVVDDNTDPTLNCPADVLIQTDPGVCTKTNIPGIGMTEVFPTIAPYLDPTDNPSDGEGIDNCGIVEWRFQLSGETNTGVIVGNDAGTQTFNLGTTTVTYFAEDAAGNVGSCSFDVEVEDSENPTATCPPVFVGLSTGQFGDPAGDCVFEFTNTNYDPKNVMDNCSIADTVFSASSTTPGVVINPTSGKSLNGMTVDLSGTANSQAAITVKWTITDGSGNPVNCSTDFLIIDDEQPVITCADDATRQISDDGNTMDCFYTVQGSEFDPTFTDDNCMVDDVYNDINFGNTLNGEDLPIQANIITWTVVDKAGNSTTCQVEVTVTDDEAPKFDYCPMDETLNNTTGDCSQLHNWLQPSVFDLTDCDPANLLSIRREVSDVNVQGALNANYPYDEEVGGFALAEFPVGMTFVYYIAEDSWGNVDTCTLKVTVLDNEAPVFAVCPGNQILGNICANDIVPDYRSLATVTDNCSLDTLIQDPAPGTLLSNVPVLTPADGESFTVTLTATDKNPNNLSTDCSFDVTLQDNAAPEPDIAGSTLPKVYNSCSYVEVEAPTATDCGEVIYGVPSQGNFIIGSNPPRYAYTTGGYNIVWTYTDQDNNSSTQNQVIEVVDDTTAPELTCPDDVTMYGTDYPNCYASNIPGIALSEGSLGSFAAGTYADTCTMNPNFTIEYALTGASTVGRKNGSNAGIEIFNTGLTTVTYWVTDEAGNESSCSFTVMVMDDDAPDLSVPPNVTVECDMVPSAPDIFATDNCDGSIQASLMEDNIPGSCENEYTLVRTWTVSDVKGNATAGTQILTVIDTQAPDFNLNTGALDVVTTNDLNECHAFVRLILDPADVTDNCDGDVTITNSYTFGGNDASGIYPVGTTLVVFTAEDNCGNSSTYEVDVTVQDNEDPVIACIQGLAFNIPDTDTLVLKPSDLYFFVRDNCAIDTVTMSQDTFTCEDVTGDFTDVILTATDIHGNIGVCTATVLIQDNIPPMAKCQDITAYLDENGEVVVTGADLDGGSTDNCDNQLSYFINSVGTLSELFTCDHKGDNLRTMIVQDPSGNTDFCSANITVADTIDPVAVCRDITVSLDANGIAALDSNAVDNGSSDNCMITEFGLTPNTFTCADIGNVNIVQMIVTDMAGNKDTCEAQVTVVDDLAPVAVCADTTIYLNDAGFVSIDETYIDGGSTDNCDMDLDFAFRNQFSCADTGVNMVTVTVTDDYDNSATCVSNVTVRDTTPPIAACMDATLTLDSAGFAVLNVNDVWDASNSSDNCGIEHVRLSQTIFDCNNKNQMNPVTLELEDYSGNKSTCEANVTVVDVFGPHLECRDITVFVEEGLAVEISAEDVIDSVFDPCGLQDTIVSQSIFDCSHAGDNTVTVTATDFTGNVSACQANVRVEYTTPPMAVCQDITVVLGEDGVAGQVTIDPEEVDGGSEDACGFDDMLELSVSPNVFDCDDLGDNLVELTVTDRFDNTSTCTATVTVEPSELDVLLDDVSGDQGQVVTIPITVNDFIEITSLQFTTEILDVSVGRFIDATINNLDGADINIIDDGTVSFQFNAPGAIPVSRTNGSTIAFLDIELTGTTGEMSDVIFTDSELSREWSSDCDNNPDANMGFNETNGSITVDMSPAMFTMGGTVRYYSDSDSVENVSIEISGHGFPDEIVQTDANGEYSFTALAGSDPVITPLDMNSGFYDSERDYYLAKEGGNQTVTTFDNFVISQHIFGLDLLSGPYQLIAADVAATAQGPACSGVEINVGDISEINSVLAQVNNSWAHNSWVFIPDNFVFNNNDCPWEGGYAEAISLTNVGAAQGDLDFIAIKIGDVDGSFELNSQLNGGGQNKDNEQGQLDIEVIRDNNVLRFAAINGERIGSIQFGVKFNKAMMNIVQAKVNEELMQSAQLAIDEESGELIFLGFDMNTADLAGRVLFEIELVENIDADLNEFMRISSEAVSNEVFSDINGFGQIVLQDANSTNADDVNLAQFELLQNAPNPFNQTTNIRWILPYNTMTDVIIMNDLGQSVFRRTVEGKKGLNTLSINTADLPATGVYYYQVKTQNFFGTKSMILTK